MLYAVFVYVGRNANSLRCPTRGHAGGGHAAISMQIVRIAPIDADIFPMNTPTPDDAECRVHCVTS